MKSIIAIFLLTSLFFGQTPAKKEQEQPRSKTSPRLAFVDTTDTPGLVDTDQFDAQKYMEGVGSDSSSVKATRAAHETELTREFVDGFNSAKECDHIVFMGAGDNKPDFALQIMVDSHDTPKQKPVWNWVMRDIHTGKLMPVGIDENGKTAAADVCRAVWNATDPDHFKKAVATR